MISISKINNRTSFGSLVLGEKACRVVQKMSEMKSPAQRGVIGATALILQPTIDSLNPKVDKKTKETSMARSVAKAIICTTTGITLRSAFIKLAEYLSKDGKAFCIEQIKNNTDPAKFRNYTNAVGTGLALAAMLITNFAIDAPLTNLMQNKITKHVFHHDNKDQEPKPEASK